MTRPRSADSRHRSLRVVVAAAATAVLAGCSQFAVDGLALRADRSISIAVPADRTSLTAPLTVSWTDADPRANGSYLVLIDRSPMPPGETVAWFAKGDLDCAASTSCPDALYLARRGVTISTATSVEISIVPPLTDVRSNAFHELTIVRLGADGRRDGETSATVQFELVKP